MLAVRAGAGLPKYRSTVRSGRLRHSRAGAGVSAGFQPPPAAALEKELMGSTPKLFNFQGRAHSVEASPPSSRKLLKKAAAAPSVS